MSQLDPLKDYAKLQFGARVDRATAVFTGISSTPIFTIAGGRVAIKSIIGQITTGASGATNISLVSNPTTGTSADIGTAKAAAGLEIGTLLTISGTVADAVYAVSAGTAQAQARDVIVPIGAIEFSLSAGETISVKWSIFYVPIDDGAYVEAA
jgi:hypothetical protein